MLFSSITFLYLFLPIVIFLYILAPQKSRNFVLFVMSVLFYAWGEPVYVFLMLAQIVAAFVLTGGMERFRGGRIGRIFYILSVLLPFLALFYFKYYSFFMENVFGMNTKSLPLPIGISFYTFQIVSYCIDVYHQRIDRQRNIITFAAYVTLFPQLVAGPIVRYSEIERTLVEGVKSSDICVSFEKGIVRFVTGLGKKVLIANVLGEFVTEVSGLEQRTLMLSWMYAIAVAMQLYFDFSGYSDMAIGLGGMFGFSFPENFRYPFISKSVSEFWRRWHITLGAWFRDYVYIPMGGNRVGKARWIWNIFVVWLFTGLWHGAGWNFIVWGLMFAVLLVFEKVMANIIIGRFWKSITFKSMDNKIMSCALNFVRHVYVVFVILVSFLVFHNESLGAAWSDVQSLVGSGAHTFQSTNLTEMSVCTYLLRNRIGILCIGLIGSTPLPFWLWKQIAMRFGRNKVGDVAMYVLRAIFTVGLLVLCTAYLIDGSFNPFLYFRF